MERNSRDSRLKKGGDKKKYRLDDVVVVQYDVFSTVVALDQMYKTSGCALQLLADRLAFDVDAYSFKSTEFVCLSSVPEKQRTNSFAFPWNFLVKLLFAFEPYGWALLQAVPPNKNTKVRYPETSLRLRRDILEFQQLRTEHTC